MSDALGSLLIGEEIESETEEGSLRERFPLNDKVASCAYEGSDSERVRLRRVIAELEEQGLTVSGAEPSQYLPDAQVAFTGAFDQQGYLKNGRPAVTLASDLSDGQRELVQASLLTHGFCALVTEAGEIRVLAFETREDRDLIEWYELGLPDRPDGIDIDEARRWVRAEAAFVNNRRLVLWIKSGFDLDVARRWVTCEGSLSDPGVACAWIDAGVSPDEASAWAALRPAVFSRYDMAEPWRSRMDADEAALWLKAASTSSYRPDVSKVDEMKAQGVSAEFIAGALKAGVEEVHLPRLARLVAGGTDPEEAIEWGKLGGQFLSWHLQSWIDAGISAKDAPAWFEMACSLPGSQGRTVIAAQVASWIAAGYQPDGARPWIEASPTFWGYEAARGWIESGQDPSSISRWLSLAERTGEARLVNYNRLKEWWDLGDPFTEPESIERMIESGVSPQQARALLDEIS